MLKILPPISSKISPYKENLFLWLGGVLFLFFTHKTVKDDEIMPYDV